MEIGDVIRIRDYKTYGSDGRSWAQFSANEKGVRDPHLKRVFVCLLLGVEFQMLVNPKDPTGTDTAEPLDVRHQLNALGLWGEDQLKEVLGKKESDKIVKKLRKFARAKQEEKRAKASP
jgi:hypothetical protein